METAPNGPSIEWDVFISHASEDKTDVAEPLYHLLKEAGLRVWLDKLVLTLGDSLRSKIDDGLARSRFGVVIFSPRFFAKQWTQRELDGLLALETPHGKKVLPVWHQFDAQAMKQYSPLFAERLAVSTASGLAEVARAILQAVRGLPGRGTSVPLPPSPPPAMPAIEELLANANLARNAALLSDLVSLGDALPPNDPQREKAAAQLRWLLFGVESGADQPDGRASRRRLLKAIKVLAPRRLGDYFKTGELEQADLVAIDFRGSDLSGVSFRKGFLIATDFSNANLREADFSDCLMRNVQFSGADLAGANFAGADWFNALGLTREQIRAVRGPLLACPRSVDEFHEFLSDHYSYTFSTWPCDTRSH